MTALLVSVFLLPLAWSAGLTTLRACIKPEAPEDRAEKRFLVLLLLPVAAGLVLLGVARFSGMHIALPVVPITTPRAVPLDGDGAGPLAPANAGFDIMGLACRLLPAVYAAVTLVMLARLGLAWLGLQGCVARSVPALGLGSGVRLAGPAMPPLAWGRDTVILPRSLAESLPARDIALIVRHERAHLRRRDPAWFVALSLIDALFWFNPFVRLQTRRCRQAAELACDAVVTAAEPDMREAYAHALVKALKHAAGSVRQYAPAAFSPAKSGDYRMRISEIMHPQPQPRKTRRWPVLLAAGLVLPMAAVQLAWSQGAPVASTTSAASGMPGAPADFSIMPVDAPISQPFGMRDNAPAGAMKFHQGVDFAAPIGTPVHAVAAGTVTRVAEDAGYGKMIEIDDGGGFTTRYAHLDSQAVTQGSTVTVGQDIGTVGSTGISTGPHLHLEIWLDGKPQNPQSILLQPAYITADSMSSNSDGTVTATGHVVERVGSNTLRADQLTSGAPTPTVTPDH